MRDYYHISTGQFGYPQPENSYRTSTYSTDEGCPTCEIGKVQSNPFRFRGEPKPTKNHITGLNWVFDEIFVRQVVKAIFEQEGLSGISFNVPVDHKSDQPIPEFYQLSIQTVLPPSLLNENLGIEICEYPKDEKTIKFLKANGSRLVEGPFCGNKKFNFPQGQTLTFKKEAFADAPDFVRTYEWFGSGGSASRPILVSENVKNIIEQKMFKGAFFNKIELE